MNERTTITEMSIKDGNKHVVLKTTLPELERVVSELRAGTKKWEDTSDKYNNIAIFCLSGGENSSVTFWLDNPNYLR